MGADLIATIHKIPALPPNATDICSGQLDAYKAIIDATDAQWIAEAIAQDRDFDVTEFGVDDDEFHEESCEAIEQIANSPEAVAAARIRLYEIAEEYAVGRCRARAEFSIGGIWIAFYGGMSWGEEPFDGFGAVCALSHLPGLGVEHTVSAPTALAERVLGGLTDDAELDDNLVQWVNTHLMQVRGLVAAEISARESVISEAIDAALSDLEAEVRLAVHAEVATHASQ